MFDTSGIPKGLAEIPPGAMLGGILESIDRDSLSGRDRVLLMRAERRQSDHYRAEMYASMVAVAESTEELESVLPVELVVDGAADEIRAALTLTRRSAESQLDFARELVTDYPVVWEALGSGVIDVPRAMVILNQTCHLEPDVRDRVVTEAMEQAPDQTTGQLAARLRRLAISVDPDTARKRYELGVEERRVTSEVNPDGTANLYGLALPAVETQAVMRRINRLARAARDADDPRSIDQIRADILLDLLQGRAGQQGGGKGIVDITVDLEVLAGLAENPGELNGYGPVIADIARQVARDQTTSTHRVTVTENGEPVWTGTTRRRPTTHQTRHIQTQTPTCVFPGCRMPATECDLDHTRAWVEGGPTTTDNLSPLCRHDHRLKHAGWKMKRIRPGTYQWTSPLGHTYTTGPDPP